VAADMAGIAGRAVAGASGGAAGVIAGTEAKLPEGAMSGTRDASGCTIGEEDVEESEGTTGVAPGNNSRGGDEQAQSEEEDELADELLEEVKGGRVAAVGATVDGVEGGAAATSTQAGRRRWRSRMLTSSILFSNSRQRRRAFLI